MCETLPFRQYIFMIITAPLEAGLGQLCRLRNICTVFSSKFSYSCTTGLYVIFKLKCASTRSTYCDDNNELQSEEPFSFKKKKNKKDKQRRMCWKALYSSGGGRNRCSRRSACKGGVASTFQSSACQHIRRVFLIVVHAVVEVQRGVNLSSRRGIRRLIPRCRKIPDAHVRRRSVERAHELSLLPHAAVVLDMKVMLHGMTAHEQNGEQQSDVTARQAPLVVSKQVRWPTSGTLRAHFVRPVV